LQSCDYLVFAPLCLQKDIYSACRWVGNVLDGQRKIRRIPMRLLKIAAAATALSLASAPVVAQAADSVPVEDEGANEGRTALFAVLALVGVLLAVVGLGSGDGDAPVSA
jgi:hypothetical protein